MENMFVEIVSGYVFFCALIIAYSVDKYNAAIKRLNNSK